MCLCVFVGGVHVGLEGFRCISDASYHIWVTAAAPQGCRRGPKLGFRGGWGGQVGGSCHISSLKSVF